MVSEFPFELETRTVGLGPAARCVMVMTPRRPVEMGRDRLDHIARTDDVNEVEQKLIKEAQARDARVVLFRAAVGERLLWQFDPSFDDDELVQAGYVMTMGLLPLHRRFVRAGVVLLFHSGWATRECYAMRAGVERAAEGRTGHGGCDRLDRWILRTMLHHVALSDEHVLENLLPTHLSLINRRRRRVQSLVGATPAKFVD